MAANAGYSQVVSVSTDNVTYYKVAGIKSADCTPKRDMLETTNFKDANSSPAHVKIAGLQDFSAQISGDRVNPDANAQDAIRSAMSNGTAIYIKILPDGTHGWSCQCLVDHVKEGATVAGTATFEASFVGIAAATAI